MWSPLVHHWLEPERPALPSRAAAALDCEVDQARAWLTQGTLGAELTRAQRGRYRPGAPAVVRTAAAAWRALAPPAWQAPEAPRALAHPDLSPARGSRIMLPTRPAPGQLHAVVVFCSAPETIATVEGFVAQLAALLPPPDAVPPCPNAGVAWHFVRRSEVGQYQTLDMHGEALDRRAVSQPSQLRIDDARKLVDVCIRQANEGDEAAVGTLTAFLLGLRASEVTDRVVRDLDDNGRLLWIEFGKTKRSRRTLEVPALLRPYLLALAKDRPPDAQLISRTLAPRSGKKRDRYWLLRHVERLCADAEVPIVCTQSLRGLHASVATDAGATSHVVASALGHSSPAVTHAHYIDNSTARRARTRRVVGKVAPDPALRVVGDKPARAASAGATAPRKRTGRAAIMSTSASALRAVAGGAGATAEPAAPVHLVEIGQ